MAGSLTKRDVNLSSRHVHLLSSQNTSSVFLTGHSTEDISFAPYRRYNEYKQS